MKNNVAPVVPKLIKKIFIVAAVALTLSQAAVWLVSMPTYFWSRMASLDTLTMNLWYLVETLIIPSILWLGIHLSRRDRVVNTDSLFASLVLTVSATMVAGALSMVAYYMLQLAGPLGETPAQVSMTYTVAGTVLPLVIALVGTVIVIVALRRQKQW